MFPNWTCDRVKNMVIICCVCKHLCECLTVENTTAFYIWEEVGQHFLFVIGQSPHPWRQ